MYLLPVSLKASEKPQKNHCGEWAGDIVRPMEWVDGMGGGATHLERDRRENHHREPNHRKGILSTKEAAIEEADTGNHDPYESGGGEDPGDVAEVVDDGTLVGGVKGHEGPRWGEVV